MIPGRVGRRYARAIFQLAVEARQEDAVGEEMQSFLGSYTGSPLSAVLNHPAYDVRRRKAILTEVAGRLGLSVLVKNFLSLLLERQRLASVAEIARAYGRLLNEARGRVEATARAAAALTAEQREKLCALLRTICGKEVVLSEETDPELLGGLVVEVEGKVYDGSVRTQLEKLAHRAERAH